MYVNGGDRTSPFDQAASANTREVVHSNDHLFEIKNPLTYRCDLSITYTINRSRVTNILALQVMNIINSVVSFEDRYNGVTSKAETVKGRMVLPSFSWKIEF